MFKVTYKNIHTCNFNKTMPPSSPLLPIPFGSIEKDGSIDHMLHLQECKPGMPKLLSQGSSSSDAILRETFTSASTVERNCECDWDSLLRDLAEFASDNFPLI
jgi:hypothetical protein